MLFNSAVFLFFFAGVFSLHWTLPHAARRHLLLLASIVFYGYWSVPFLAHFVFAVAANYLFYKGCRRSYSGRSVAFVVALNLLNLALFKYFYLLADVLATITQNPTLAQVAVRNQSVLPEIVLPLAISFYTFQIIAFHIDVFRGRLRDPVSVTDFTLFILFFPQLIAGPIMRPDQFLPHISRRKRLSARRTEAAVALILLGVFKKVLIADSIAELIDPAFRNPREFSWQANLLAVYGFAAQIYCDFSGYSDMARGLALSLGYRLPANFRAPYFAVSFQDFWRRWHITLSTWLRDYLYIPLGGNRGSKARAHANILVTMVLGGLWHGANYTFLVWGVLHGVFLVAERALGLVSTGREAVAVRWLRRLIVFHLVCLAWVFFRAPTLRSAWEMLSTVSGTSERLLGDTNLLVFLLLVFGGVHALEGTSRVAGWIRSRRARLVPAAACALALLVAALGPKSSAFIYFQF